MVVGSREKPSLSFPLRGRGIWSGTGLEKGWQFLLVVVVKVGIGGHQVEQVLISGCSQLLGILDRLDGQLGGEDRCQQAQWTLESFQSQPRSRMDSHIIKCLLPAWHYIKLLTYSQLLLKIL